MLRLLYLIAMKTIRFWVFWRNSWVKLTLRAGRRLYAHHSSRDEEGFGYQWSDWFLDNDLLIEQWGNGGRDCDGRIDRSGRSCCPLHKLASVPAYDDGTNDCRHDGRLIMRPAWEDSGRVEIRDEYAELSGY